MRQFTIPKAQTIQITTVDPQGNAITLDKEYSFASFLAEFVWPNQAWRVTAESAEAWYTAQDLLIDAAEGSSVTFDDTTWNVFKPIATLQGKDLPGGVPLQLSRLMRPILQARQVTKADQAAAAS